VSCRFHDAEDPQPSEDEVVSKLNEQLAKAVVGKHFQAPVDKDAIDEVISSFIVNAAGKFESKWKGTTNAIVELSKLGSASKRSEIILSIISAANKASSSVECCAATLNMNPKLDLLTSAPGWKEALQSSAVAVLDFERAAKDLPVKEGDASLESLLTMIQEHSKRLGFSMSDFNNYGRKCYDAKLDISIAYFKLFAKGDPDDTGLAWWGDTPLAEITDFADVVALFDSCLRRVKASPIVKAPTQHYGSLFVPTGGSSVLTWAISIFMCWECANSTNSRFRLVDFTLVYELLGALVPSVLSLPWLA
jgi:hypothetical protein